MDAYASVRFDGDAVVFMTSPTTGINMNRLLDLNNGWLALLGSPERGRGKGSRTRKPRTADRSE